MKFIDATSTQEWQCIIRPKNKSSSWYIRNRATFGNTRWIFKFCVVPMVILTIALWIILLIFFPSHVSILYIGYHSTMSLILVTMYYYLPSFQDHFFICGELKRIILCSIANVIVSAVSWGALDLLWKPEQDALALLTAVAYLIIGTSLFLEALISTWWVMRKLKHLIIKPENQETEIPPEINSILLQNLRSNSIATEKIQLQTILSTQSYFSVFVMHLSKELSVHFLIAFVEILQLQTYVESITEIDGTAVGKSCLFRDVKLYQSVPKSWIVHENLDQDAVDTLREIKIKSSKVYDKYIEYGSENIRYDVT